MSFVAATQDLGLGLTHSPAFLNTSCSTHVLFGLAFDNGVLDLPGDCDSFSDAPMYFI